VNKTFRLAFCRGDVLAVVLVAALAVGAAFMFMPRGVQAGSTVQIYKDGLLQQELPLAQDCTVEITGAYTNTVSIKNGRVAITQSNCPGGDCLHSGWTDTAGRSIVCLPNRVEVRIAGEADVDFVVR